MTELKLCPFCGSNNIRTCKFFNYAEADVKGIATNISCMDCFANGPSCEYDKDVRKSWNERK